MATIYEVAKRAGVSTATVSAVLNRSAFVSPELTKKVKQAAAELDYRINYLAQSLQTGRTHTVAMLIPLFSTPDPFYGQVVSGAEDVLRKRGYSLIVGQTYNDVHQQSQYISAFRSRFVDGLLLFQTSGEDSELRKYLDDKRPVVFVGREPNSIQADVVATDIVKGTRLAIEHLIRKGHARIGLITVRESLSVRSGRIDGWHAALRKSGLPIDDSYIREGNLSSEGGKEAADALLSLDPAPTAIFADNLLMMVGILQALQERGKQDRHCVEVMSSDDAEWLDVFHLPISTVVQPSYELGVKAAELLLKRIRHPRRKYEHIKLEPALKIRGGWLDGQA